MIEDRFADLIRHSYQLPIEEKQPMEDTMLAAGPVTSDVPQTGVRLGRAGVTPQQSAQAGGLDKPLIALLDTLAGALRGATGATIGLPGDIRSIVDMINQEGAEAVMGKRMFPTSEEVLQSNILPQVVPAGAPNAAERQKTVDIAQSVGEFLPAPGLLDVPKVVKGATKAVQATKNMPVGMSTQMVGEGVSELGFYSAAKEAVNSIQQPKGTGEQFLKQIEKTPGVKPEEIKWTGLDDFLKSKKSVTKVEVQEFLDKNRVEVKEVELGNPLTLDEQTEIKALRQKDRMTTSDRARFDMLSSKEDSGQSPKFSKYTLPGGENYREILLTLPSKQTGPSEIAFKNSDDVDNFLTDMSMSGYENLDYGRLNDGNVVQFGDAIPSNVMQIIRNNDGDIIAGKATAGSTYGSPHFEQPNILAHLRVNDRVDADGKKVLFVEEVQSDWHQAGRKKGYDTPQVRQNIAKERQRLLDQKDYYAKLAEPYATQGKDSPTEIVDGWTQAANGLQELQRIENSMSNAVPNAPFKTTWHELSMKRAIQLAAEGGYDRVAFTTGKTQAERYDLSKQVKMISAMPNKNGTYNIYIEGNNGDALFRNQNGFGEYGQKIVTPEEFEELVGKDAASTIMQKTDELNRGKVSKDQYKFYDSKPADLTIGGEGMKKFYDQILPKFLDKYAKKWDAKTGMTKIRLATDAEDAADSALLQDLGMDGGGKATASVQYIDVTPKMKESVLTKGQPLFAIGAGGAAVQQEDNQ